MNKLQDLRDTWENPNIRVHEFDLLQHPVGAFVAIIEKIDGSYSALRYFQIDECWHVSVDLDGDSVTHKDALLYLC